MDLIDQKDKLMVKKPSRHGSLFPNTIRAILVGPSGSANTNIMYNLITHANGLRFENIYLYSKTSNQEKYVLIFSYLLALISFDDVICGPQSVISEYFSTCRHSGSSSVFYLAQTYSKIPKQLVRDNSIFLIILKQDDTNLRHIFNDHSSADMDFSEFRKMCHFFGITYCYTVHSAISSHPIQLYCNEQRKSLVRNLISSKKNIKRKIMEMKRGFIDSDNYYRDVFMPIVEPLSTRTEKNTLCNSQTS
ncbi:tigger transposable element-derived protein 4-like [Aphis craccivora]|uniref:Tigger transposable element-derived protein 4-like n=1 Tax=Aphis craccivora TaxID=307492 RepID=A0A6G0VM41_APHCR|nr:tigger transposable element-derived protein 4-like [Aphis craccivora]